MPLAVSLTQSPSAFSIFSRFSICWGCCSPSGTRFDPLFGTFAKLFPLVGRGFPNLLLCRAGLGSPSSPRKLAELLLPDISCTVPLTIAQGGGQISEVLGDGQTLSRPKRYQSSLSLTQISLKNTRSSGELGTTQFQTGFVPLSPMQQRAGTTFSHSPHAMLPRPCLHPACP